MTKLLFIDTETGGTDPNTHSILTAAFAVWEDGEVVDTLELSIVHEAYVVTSKAMEVNGIDLKAHKGISPFQAQFVIQEFVARHFDEKPTIVGQNVQFDEGFLKALLGSSTYEGIFSHRVIDTASILRFLQLSGSLDVGGSGLSDAIKFFGIQMGDERHTALGDVLATVVVFNKLLEHMKGLQVDWAKVAREANHD